MVPSFFLVSFASHRLFVCFVLFFLQLSTLVSLKLLTLTGSSAMFQGLPKYRCNASYDLVRGLARTVNFELPRYLYDVSS